ncbi:MAG: hypothetical protein L7F78_23645, partial [Syntrophales bacterium LBB04]|nr:hypothetical protein [Syntrophales bacterium LBB04]
LPRVVSDILELNGYKTIQVEDGNEAYEFLSDREKKIDLVILDIYRYDNIDIEEIYCRIMSICPEMKILVTSGFAISRKLDDKIVRDSVGTITYWCS